jgi:hypothetical protein
MAPRTILYPIQDYVDNHVVLAAYHPAQKLGICAWSAWISLRREQSRRRSARKQRPDRAAATSIRVMGSVGTEQREPGQLMSKRSLFITLVQTLTKS